MTQIQENTEESSNGVHVVYKKLGETPLECMERFRAENTEYAGVSLTYAGRLDPMAEGLLIVLSGKAVFMKEQFIGLSKTYEVEIVWGFETDTLDVLGILSRVTLDNSPRVALGEEVKEELSKKVGKFQQKYPAYSSRTVDGPIPDGSGRTSKPLFQWARDGRLEEIEIPEHEVEIMEVPVCKNRREISDKKKSHQRGGRFWDRNRQKCLPLIQFQCMFQAGFTCDSLFQILHMRSGPLQQHFT
jgi:tRNA U55 pseudouridine synthase TruB